tara:strand:- start:281 stop:448 length:168 start_codon:yes stop_codon:yes gene_type:complete
MVRAAKCVDLAKKVKFRLEFMSLMMRVGREEEAQKSFNKAYDMLIEMSGEERYNP